jgi:hypothetical protein
MVVRGWKWKLAIFEKCGVLRVGGRKRLVEVLHWLGMC